MGSHPIDIYVSKPITFEIFTFMQYFKQNTHDCKMYSTYQHFGKDNIGFNISENKKLIWFTYFHPIYNNEGNFFSIFDYNIYYFKMKKNYYHK